MLWVYALNLEDQQAHDSVTDQKRRTPVTPGAYALCIKLGLCCRCGHGGLADKALCHVIFPRNHLVGQ
jgi:hypothetical protein